MTPERSFFNLPLESTSSETSIFSCASSHSDSSPDYESLPSNIATKDDSFFRLVSQISEITQSMGDVTIDTTIKCQGLTIHISNTNIREETTMERSEEKNREKHNTFCSNCRTLDYQDADYEDVFYKNEEHKDISIHDENEKLISQFDRMERKRCNYFKHRPVIKVDQLAPPIKDDIYKRKYSGPSSELLADKKKPHKNFDNSTIKRKSKKRTVKQIIKSFERKAQENTTGDQEISLFSEKSPNRKRKIQIQPDSLTDSLEFDIKLASRDLNEGGASCGPTPSKILKQRKSYSELSQEIRWV